MFHSSKSDQNASSTKFFKFILDASGLHNEIVEQSFSVFVAYFKN